MLRKDARGRRCRVLVEAPLVTYRLSRPGKGLLGSLEGSACGKSRGGQNLTDIPAPHLVAAHLRQTTSEFLFYEMGSLLVPDPREDCYELTEIIHVTKNTAPENTTTTQPTSNTIGLLNFWRVPC